MSHYIKVKDTDGNVHEVQTTEDTSFMNTDRAIQIASIATGLAQIGLTFLSKGKYKPKQQ